MNPILELQAQLARPERRESGTIVERIGTDRYRVRTTGAVVEAIASSNAAYRAGDSVAVRDGVIVGRIRNPSTLKTYPV